MKENNFSKLLRIKAEEKLTLHNPDKGAQSLSESEIYHEIQVHQIELEIQNEELRKAQSVLEEMRDRYVGLYEYAPMGYLTLSRDGVIIESNIKAGALLGVEREKLMKLRFDHVVALADRDRWRNLFLNLMMHGGSQDIDLMLQGNNDEVFHTHVNCTRVQPGTPPARMRVAFTVTHERGMLLRQLHEMRKLLNDVQRLSKIGCWKYNCVNGEMIWTDELYQIYGVQRMYDSNNIKSHAELYVPEDRPIFYRAFERAVKYGEPYDLEMRLNRSHGEKVWVQSIGKPIIEGDKTVVVTGMVMDISLRKKSEEAIITKEKFVRGIVDCRTDRGMS